MKKIKNYILLGVRGGIYYLFYKLRFSYAIKTAKEKSNIQIVEIVIGKIKYKMKIDLRDTGLSHDLYINNIREYPNVFFFVDFLKKYSASIDCIIDIGANIGYYALLEAKIIEKFFQKKINILAIEPVKENFSLLQENIKINKQNNMKAINIAVGEEDKKVKIIMPELRNLSQLQGVSKDKKVIKNASVSEVYMKTLKTLIKDENLIQKNLLFRWDIEGYEYNLIKGNFNFFKNLKKAFIIMEFHSFYLKKRKSVEFLKIVENLGFKLECVVSCEPIYFLKSPKVIRYLLKKLWLIQNNGTNLGILKEFSTIDDLIRDLKRDDSPLYKYSNLHFYFIKE